MKTVMIATIRKRRDGTACLRNGRYLSARIRTHAVAVRGVWAVTPFYSSVQGFSAAEYQVTHIHTGFCAFTWGLPLRTAKVALQRFARLPEQARWRRLKNTGHMTKTMRAAGTALRNEIANG